MQTNRVTIDGEPVTFVSFTDEEWNLAAENNCDTVIALDRDAVCDLSLLGQDVCFEEINPEDIIGDGVGDRDWGQRSRREKPAWHMHVSFSGWHGMICAAVHADIEEEAREEAISSALVCLEGELLLPIDSEEGDDDYEEVHAYLSDLTREGSCCFHDVSESCPDGCVKIKVARMT